MYRGTRGWVWGGCSLLRCGVLAGVAVCWLVFVGGALGAGDATTAPGEVCPNEASPGFRSSLPDCRAYELVTPVYKQGFEAEVEAISEDGTRVNIQSLGVFAGLEGGDRNEGAYYQLSRSSSGWEVSPLSLASSVFPTQVLAAASPDLSKTLFSARTAEESALADNFYLREANGATVEVGPLFSPAVTAGPPAGEFDNFEKQLTRYVDASGDLSHVFYRMARPIPENDAWPGDSTVGQESLLEYSGAGNSEPELVGVKQGPEEAKAKPSEHPALVSTCGTALGSLGSQDVYNAVSANGASVFFTAVAPPFECGSPLGVGPEVNELYARLGGRETVAVSEPSAAQCEACLTGVKAPAEFEGASEDGSKVFFMTDQELLSGAKGSSLYEYDFDNPVKEEVLTVSVGSAAPEVQGVARVSEDGSHVYFVARGVLSSEPDRSLPVGRQVALAGGDNLYVFERDATHPAGRVAFIAMLCSGLEESGALLGVAQCQSSNSDAEDWQQSDIRPVQATPDGRFLVFQSTAELSEGDTSSKPQIFEYDALTGEVVRVSRGASNDQPIGTESANLYGSRILAQGYANATSPAEAGRVLAVSADGSRVVFTSKGALTVGAELGTSGRNPLASEYEYESSVAAGGSIGDGDVYLIAPPGPPEPQLDASGEDVFFRLALSLVPEDSDTQFDLYDARVDGGFPGVVAPVVCGGAGCAPAVGGSGVGVPGSAGVVGGGALPPPPPPPSPASPSMGHGSLSRAQKLARALRACKKDKKRAKRLACERAAHRSFGAAGKADGGRGAAR
jgi:hypothetical protein